MANPSSIYTMDVVNGVRNRSFCDASFSSYLRPNEENYHADSLIKQPSVKSKTGVQHSEIGVFDAENYFKMETGDGSPAISENSLSKFRVEKNDDRVDLQGSRAKSRPGTPSASCESSCGSSSSPSALFSSFPSHKERKAIGNQFLAGFPIKGPPSDRNSAHANENGVAQVKEFLKKTLQFDQNSAAYGYQKEDTFTLPRRKSGAPNIVKSLKTQTEEVKPEQGRDSIEVFGSHVFNKGDIVENLERKLSVLTWDAIPQTPKVKSNNSRTGETCYHDGDSDSSSDLFEIENIGASRKPPLVRQQSDGDMSCCMTPTTMYAPSEASIAWSVVTARASDFRATSGYNERKIVAPSSSANKHKILKSLPASGFLGCRNNKAVKVVEPAYKK